jgi:hypothetical protein
VLKIVLFLLSGFAAIFGLLLGASYLLDRVSCLQPEGLGFESAVLSFVQKVRSPIQCVFVQIGLVLLNREDAKDTKEEERRRKKKKILYGEGWKRGDSLRDSFTTFSASVCFAIPILPICLINVPLCENVKRTLKPKVRKGLLNALSHTSDAKYQNILFVKLVSDRLNN